MRICHVSPHLPPDQAANAILPAALGRWGHARGDGVSFVTLPPAQGRPAGGDPLPGPVVHVAGRSGSGLARLTRLDTLRRMRSIASGLARVAADADLLHLHSNGLIVEVAAAWARRRGVPFVLTLYGTEIWHYRRRWPVDPFTRAYHQARAVTFYSQGLLDRARELGLAREDLTVIYPSVAATFTALDAEARRAVRQDLGWGAEPVVLNVKRLHELAGQRYLIEAFAAIRRDHPSARLVICGTGALEGELKARARTLGVAQAVQFTGLIPNAAVARHAVAADVFALPSLLEALPTVAVEALAVGTPVVSADHPGGVELHALFGDDVALVPRRDVPALADALRPHLRSPRRARPATAVILAERFGTPAIENAYATLYDRAIL